MVVSLSLQKKLIEELTREVAKKLKGAPARKKPTMRKSK
jgi:hypothetical protein